MLQIRLLVGSPRVGSSGGDKSAGVSAWLQTAAPWGLTDPGAKKEGGRQRGRDEHLLALSLFLSHFPLLFCPIRSPWGTLARTSKQPLYIHSPCASLQSLCPHIGPLSPLYMCLRPSVSLPLSHCGKLCFISLWVGVPLIHTENKQAASLLQEDKSNIFSGSRDS